MENLKFIDLFAGLGGFHVALSSMGYECVFASERKKKLRKLYHENFGIDPHGDITEVDIDKIPQHDILCAGFPCQPFSKAGSQYGFKDKKNGYLFDYIVDILQARNPKYFILENVRNLEKHEKGKTLGYLIECLQDYLRYEIDFKVISPHHFNIPQHRERFFIVGSKEGLGNFKWPRFENYESTVHDIITENSGEVISLEADKVYALELWQSFLNRIPKDVSLPGPLWSMEFGATYPYLSTTPHVTSTRKLGMLTGNFGISLKGLSREEKFENLPSYARTKSKTFPKWKENFIRKNRQFYLDYGHLFDDLIYDIEQLGVPSWQKLEWNLKGEKRKIDDYLIQFRGSGIRLKRTDYFPSLVTVSTQIPVIGWEKRYLTKLEGAKLQNLEMLKLPDTNASAFEALGNAVNSEVVRKIVGNLVSANPNKNLNKQLELSLAH